MQWHQLLLCLTLANAGIFEIHKVVEKMKSKAPTKTHYMPWQSVHADGSLETVYPTQVAGVWQDLEPEKDTSFSHEHIDTSIWANCEKNDYTIPDTPICAPRNGSVLIRDEMYAITWDSEAFGDSETVDIVLRYTTGKKTRGVIMTDSGAIPNAQGFFSLKIRDEWLKGEYKQGAQIVISPSKVIKGHKGPYLGPLIHIQRDEDEPEKNEKQEKIKEATSNNIVDSSSVVGISVIVPILLFTSLGLLWIWFLCTLKLQRNSNFAQLKRMIGRKKYKLIDDDDVEMETKRVD